jgi:hypothetical protein
MRCGNAVLQLKIPLLTPPLNYFYIYIYIYIYINIEFNSGHCTV